MENQATTSNNLKDDNSEKPRVFFIVLGELQKQPTSNVLVTE